ncbi:MAG: SDR family oxidoreductase [Candidatus Rokubacteria bacterium]|nr:SDR family oxidoreductase [Candidatus Rokubacteria bacterium]
MAGDAGRVDLAGHVALVTGGSRGIGAATARILAAHGASVGVNYRADQAGADSVVRAIETGGGRAMGLQADVSKREEVERMVEQLLATFGRIDILVNNAGAPAPLRGLLETDWSAFQEAIDVGVRGAFECMKAVAGPMVSRGSGHIINVATVYAVGSPPPRLAPYVTAKHALVGLSKAAAVELGPHGITVNLVSPGLTETEFTARVPQKLKEIVAGQTPLRRNATPDDVARVILFLAGGHAAFLTGVNVLVCGGQVML